MSGMGRIPLSDIPEERIVFNQLDITKAISEYQEGMAADMAALYSGLKCLSNTDFSDMDTEDIQYALQIHVKAANDLLERLNEAPGCLRDMLIERGTRYAITGSRLELLD